MTTGSPWFRASGQPGPEPIPEDHGPQAPEQRPYEQSRYEQQSPSYEQQDPYDRQGSYDQTGYGYEQQGPYPYPYPAEPSYGDGGGTAAGAGYLDGPGHQAPHPYETPVPGYETPTPGYATPATGYETPVPGYETPTPGYGAPATAYEAPAAGHGARPAAHQAPRAPEPPREAVHAPVREPHETDGTREMPALVEEAERPVEALPGPGRAERRRAAAKQGRGKGRPAAGAATGASADGAAERPLSRVEARRAAREAKAAKDSVGVVVGELFITLGVVMLLFVAYQLWWTNVLAGQETDQAKERIEDTWAKGENKPDVFAPGEGFAIMYIPKLDVVVPVAEGISKPKVLDKGMVGHYGEGKLKTAMPSDKQGNFAVAGHRNTHGEPFRYINRLKPGDPIVVETQDAYYTYEMASILPQTAPSNIAVIDPIPKGSGFTEPGRYITLTTCTPEFTSTYRMIVWGKLVEERPRSKGKPTALVG
ncbi:class E sortase [Streptomyces roseolus]|uniref:class E sortase n=1 Tax=Streptomyces roseolus TaxID=67358 RepID=UPI0036E1426B